MDDPAELLEARREDRLDVALRDEQRVRVLGVLLQRAPDIDARDGRLGVRVGFEDGHRDAMRDEGVRHADRFELLRGLGQRGDD